MPRKTTTYGQRGGVGATRGKTARTLVVRHEGEEYRKQTYLEGDVHWLLCHDVEYDRVDLLCFSEERRRDEVRRGRLRMGCHTLQIGVMEAGVKRQFKSSLTVPGVGPCTYKGERR